MNQQHWATSSGKTMVTVSRNRANRVFLVYVVTLTITYPNGDVTTVNTVTDGNGAYSFDNLLLDEDYNGTGTPGAVATQPTYEIYGRDPGWPVANYNWRR